ncbi:MAG: single-stranded-DNA-specific exonuclease RecJ [Burkholderiales bacterium]
MSAAPPRLVTRSAPAPARQRLLAAGLHPVLARVYAARGIGQADELNASLADLLPPDGLLGIAPAAERLAQAIAAREPMLIVADYDCDGATACAVGIRGLRALGAVVDFLVPNRLEHGYGLTPPIVDLAAAHPRLGRPALIITVDNGIASLEGVDRARALGIDVVVTDHHLPGESLPQAAAIVNPNQPGCGFASKHLAGVGVMFYLLLALRALLRARGAFRDRPEPALQALLDLVAVGTVADLVRLDRNNRLLVSAGLRRIRAGQAQAGVRALFAVAGREWRSAGCQDIGFGVGPRINAAGRLSDISLGIECLITDDEDQAHALAAELDGINRSRRELEERMRDEALAEVGEPAADALTLVVHRPDWHAGVVGLVATRLKDRHHRPTLALAPAGETGCLQGSGRSIPGVHLRDAIDLAAKRAPGAVLRFGGHAMAAGLTLRADALARFGACFEQAVAELADPGAFSPELATDGTLAGEPVDLELVEAIDRAVWGQGFPAPLFADEAEVLGQRLLKERHLRVDLRIGTQTFAAIAFGRTEPLPRRALVAYRLNRNDWGGRASLQLLIEQVGAPL